MERLMLDLTQGQFTENLRQTNRRLRFCLQGLAPDQAHPTSPTPQLISELLSELLRSGAWLRRGLPAPQGPQLRAELVEYRRNLECLQDRMPAIHSHLLAERARLEAERTRIESAVEWAQGSRQTL
ncbi:MAG: hypothetical protein WCF26_06765 [Candidatus Sulfotelmatobacter sp.]